MTVAPPPGKHPAMFPPRIIEAIRRQFDLDGKDRGIGVLDPFCGAGRIAQVAPGNWHCYGIEIEDEWASQARDVGVTCRTGDSRTSLDDEDALPIFPDEFAAVITSPCYGNRMADLYAPPPDVKHRMRRTYRIALGRDLSEGSAGGMQWGATYRELHRDVWTSCVAHLRPGGKFILNIKNHVRGGVEQPVSEWHVQILLGLGLYLRGAEFVPLRGDQNTATMRARGIRVVEGEWVITFEKGDQR